MKLLLVLLGLCAATWAQQQPGASHFQIQTHRQNQQRFDQRQQGFSQDQQGSSQGQQGFSQGQQGSSQGQQQRFNQGQQQRFNQGQQQRFPQGQQQGLSRGQQQGSSRGQPIGFSQGQQQGFNQLQSFGQGRRRPRPTPKPTTTTTPKPTTSATQPPRLLTLPDVTLCQNRPKQWQHGGRNYYFSWDQEEALGVPASERGKKVDWLEARNQCRLRCMDAVSLETEAEAKMVSEFITSRNVSYIWTSGRLCDFPLCETRNDLKPLKIRGWFWSNTNTKMADTNKIPPGWSFQPWSKTGHNKVSQPDNAEFDINNTTESCLGVLNNIYKDGVVWHDIACYHKKPYICEDSDLLLRFIEGTHKVKL